MLGLRPIRRFAHTHPWRVAAAVWLYTALAYTAMALICGVQLPKALLSGAAWAIVPALLVPLATHYRQWNRRNRWFRGLTPVQFLGFIMLCSAAFLLIDERDLQGTAQTLWSVIGASFLVGPFLLATDPGDGIE